MNKTNWFGSLFIALAISGGYAAHSHEHAHSCGEREVVAVLLSSQGEVLAGGRPAVAATSICGDDVVETGAMSRARIQLVGAGTPITLKANTRLRIPRAQPAASGLLGLLDGALYFLGKVRNRVTIETSLVSYAVEGTEFYLQTGKNGTKLVLFEGQLATADADGAEIARLRTAQMLDVDASGAAEIKDLDTSKGLYVPLRVAARDSVAWTIYFPPLFSPDGVNLAPTVIEAGNLLRSGDVAGAEAALETVPDDRGSRAAAAALRAIIAVSSSDLEQAEERSALAMELAPTLPAAVIARSYLLQARFEIEAARALVAQAVETSSPDALVLARLAELELAVGDARAAQGAATRSIALQETAPARMVQGFAALADDDPTAALSAFEASLGLDPEFPLAWLGRGLTNLRQGAAEEGRRALEVALAHDPSSALLRSYLGKAFLEELLETEAFVQFDMAKDLDPADPTPHLYSAIALQLANRPVEALHSLEAALLRNDNRAVYRSRMLLDADDAIQDAGVARLYADLGLDALGLAVASDSATETYDSFAPHQFRAELLSGEPGQEITRLSEVVQARMLRRTAAHLDPSYLQVGDLRLADLATSIEPSLNEYTSLTRSQDQAIRVGGLLGNRGTRAEELTGAIKVGSAMLGLGQFHLDTDGFRDNAGANHQVYSAIAQTDVSDTLTFQLEGLYRNTRQGDLDLRYFRNAFNPDERNRLRERSGRFGLRWHPDRRTTVLASASITRRESGVFNRTFVPADPLSGFPDFFSVSGLSGSSSGRQLEALISRDHGNSSTLAGIRAAKASFRIASLTDADPCPFGPGACLFEGASGGENRSATGYLYHVFGDARGLQLTIGGALDHLHTPGRDETNFLPKAGVSWSPDPAVTFRAAAFRAIKPDLAANQLLEPTHVAGINQFRDDFSGTRVDVLAAGIEGRPTKELRAGLSVERRESSVPLRSGPQIFLRDREERIGSAYLGVLPRDDLAITLGISLSEFNEPQSSAGGSPMLTRTLAVPVEVSYFHPSGPKASITATFLRQDLQRQELGEHVHRDDGGLLLDASLEFPINRSVSLFLDGRNLLDRDLNFHDDNFRSSVKHNAQFAPSLEVIGRVRALF